MQPTPFCNIDCEYCYLPNRSISSKMSMDVLGKIVLEVFSSSLVESPIDFLWHLGEPLAVPMSFYEKAFSIIDEIGSQSNKAYSLSFQTNAMLLNEDWINLIRKYNINIGVSIDGPKFIHDRKRMDRKKRGTHARVMKGVRMLQEANIKFSTIMVISEYSLSYPDEICSFFLKNNIDEIGFNIDEIEGINSSSSFSEVGIQKFQDFINRLLEISVQSKGKLRIREFWLNLKPFMLEVSEPLNTTSSPFKIFNFDVNGNYSTYCPELLGASSVEYNNFFMGNIVTDGLDSIQENPVFVKIKQAIDLGIEQCKNTCEYWAFCGGGSPSNKFFENGTFNSAETLACRFQKKEVINMLANHFESELT